MNCQRLALRAQCRFFLSAKNARLELMATIFQTKEWEKFKLATGWQKSWRVFDILVLQRKIPPLGSMLYTPMASRDQTKLAMQKIFRDQIEKIAQESGAMFYRLESDDEAGGDIDPKESGYVKAFEEMQPEHTLIVDLTKSLEDILSQMKQKGRYNIKIAQKHEVLVEKGKVEDFFKLYEEMAKRQKITYRSIPYFQTLIDNLSPKDYVEVFIAKQNPKSEYRNPKQTQSNSNDQNSKVSNLENSNLDIVSNLEFSASNFPILASAIVVFYKDVCTYLFGGSSELEREKMAPYKLHFEIMQEAKKRGCKYYDMFGIAPNDDEKHPWAGISKFKKQFGGTEFTSLGSWDLVFSPVKYRLFKIAEKFRRS